MGPTLIDGLPAHVLFVHVVVVLVPLTALVLVVCSVWTSWITRLGLVLPALALVTLVSVPLTTHAGEWLRQHTDNNPLVRRHAELGDTLLPWVLGLFVVAVGVWWVGRRARAAAAAPASSGADGPAPAPTAGIALSVPVRVAAITLSVIVAAGSTVQVYRIGESGAKAAWHEGYSAKRVDHHRD